MSLREIYGELYRVTRKACTTGVRFNTGIGDYYAEADGLACSLSVSHATVMGLTEARIDHGGTEKWLTVSLSYSKRAPREAPLVAALAASALARAFGEAWPLEWARNLTPVLLRYRRMHYDLYYGLVKYYGFFPGMLEVFYGLAWGREILLPLYISSFGKEKKHVYKIALDPDMAAESPALWRMLPETCMALEPVMGIEIHACSARLLPWGDEQLVLAARIGDVYVSAKSGILARILAEAYNLFEEGEKRIKESLRAVLEILS